MSGAQRQDDFSSMMDNRYDDWLYYYCPTYNMIIVYTQQARWYWLYKLVFRVVKKIFKRRYVLIDFFRNTISNMGIEQYVLRDI